MKTSTKIIISIIVMAITIGLISVILIVVKKNTKDKKIVNVYSVYDIGYDGSYAEEEETISGQVVSGKEQQVFAYSDKKVAEILVKEGDKVKPGDVLLRYDMTERDLELESLAAEIELARADLVMAQKELQELKQMKPKPPTTEKPTTEKTTEEKTTEEKTTEEKTTEDNTTEDDDDDDGKKKKKKKKTTEEVVTTEETTTEETTTEEATTEDDDYDEYTEDELRELIIEKEAEVKELDIEYQLRQVEYDLEKCQSPTGEVLCNYKGVVKKVGDPYQCYTNHEPFIVVAGNGGYTVRSYIGELDLENFTVGDTVSMTCYEDGQMYDGIITEISDMPNDNYNGYGVTQTYYPMTISVDGSEQLAQGADMEVSFERKRTSSESIYIPLAFIMSEGGNYYVMKEEKGVLKKCYVKTGKILWGESLEIKSGLTMDDYIAFPYVQDAAPGVKTKRASSDELYNY